MELTAFKKAIILKVCKKITRKSFRQMEKRILSLIKGLLDEISDKSLKDSEFGDFIKTILPLVLDFLADIASELKKHKKK